MLLRHSGQGPISAWHYEALFCYVEGTYMYFFELPNFVYSQQTLLTERYIIYMLMDN